MAVHSLVRLLSNMQVQPYLISLSSCAKTTSPRHLNWLGCVLIWQGNNFILEDTRAYNPSQHHHALFGFAQRRWKIMFAKTWTKYTTVGAKTLQQNYINVTFWFKVPRFFLPTLVISPWPDWPLIIEFIQRA